MIKATRAVSGSKCIVMKRAACLIVFLGLFNCAPKTEPSAAGETVETAPAEGPQSTEVRMTRLIPDPSRRAKAVSLDARGMELIAAGKLPEAADLFRDSILADSTYLNGHYNLACTLALLTGRGETSHEEELYDELDIALGIDAIDPPEGRESVAQAMKSDPRLDPIRDKNRFKILLMSKDKPRRIGLRDRILGSWRTNYPGYSLTFKDDNTYAYQTGQHSPGMKKEGTWALDEAKASFTLFGEKLAVNVFDRATKKQTSRTISGIEFDPSRLVFRLSGGDSSPADDKVLQKAKTPLQEALTDLNAMETAGLLCQGILPGNEYFKEYSYPFKTAVDSERVALIRLFVGKEGVAPYPRMRIAEKHPCCGPLRDFRESFSRSQLQEAAGRARFPENRYREVIRRPFLLVREAPWPEEAPDALYLMDGGDRYLAFLENSYGEANVGDAYSIWIFDADSNKQVQDLSLYRSVFPYPAMKRDESIVRLLMDTEGEWIPMLEKYGLSLSNKNLSLSSFPLRLRGRQYDLAVEAKQIPDPIPAQPIAEEPNFHVPQDMGNSYKIKVGNWEVASAEGMECQVFGYTLLGAAKKEYLVVFFSTLHRFEWGDTTLNKNIASIYVGQ